MNWAQPAWLLLWGPLALLGLVVGFMGWRHGTRLKAAFGAVVFEQVLPGSVRIRRTLRDLAMLAGLGLVVVALAEPRFDKQIRTVKATGVDLVLVVDLSRSMDAQDVEPSRLERARREVADLFRVLQGDRVGLVVYAGGAYPRLPLTEDLAAVQLVLSELDTTTFDAQGSALGSAIRVGVELLQNSSSPAGKALLVLSDGEIHEGDDSQAAAQEAADLGVTIYAMGIGERAAPIPVPGGWLAYGDEQVMSVPSDVVLKDLARITGGAYVKSVAAPSDVVGLYEGEMRRKLTAVERDAQQREVWRSAFQWPLGLGLVLMLLGSWVGDGRRPLGGAAMALLVLSLGAVPTPAVAGTVADADRLYRDGSYGEAAKELTELSLENPTSPKIYDRLGAARYRAGDFEGAARAWDTASRLSGGAGTDALYNAGNAHWRAGRLEEAAERYSEVLRRDPSHGKAAGNAELLAQEIEARRNQPPPPPPKPDSEGEDEETPEGGGDPDEDPSQGEQGDQDPQDGGESDSESDSDPDSEGQPEGADPTPGVDEVEPNDDEGEDESSDQQVEGGGQSSEMGEESEEITAGQADRMLDSVEEGTPELKVRGKPGGKPW